jgi:hypothetical protein
MAMPRPTKKENGSHVHSVNQNKEPDIKAGVTRASCITADSNSKASFCSSAKDISNNFCPLNETQHMTV